MQNDTFDQRVKTLLHDAEETVSPRVWQGVSAHLDRLAARQRAFLWWKRAGIAVAAAAAVAGIFFIGTQEHSQQPNLLTTNQPSAAVAVHPAGTSSPERDAATTAVPEYPAVTTSVPTEVSAPRRLEAVPTEELGNEVVSEIAAIAAEPAAQDSFASLGMTEMELGTTEDACDLPTPQTPDLESDEAAIRALMQEENATRSRGASLSIGGKLQSNGNPSASSHAMRRAALTLGTPTTGIQEISSQSVYAAPLSFGIGVRFDLNERWSVGTGLSWSTLGRTFNGIYNEVDGTLSTVKSTSSEIRNTQQYIGVPVNLYFHIVNDASLRFYTYAGATFEKNLLNSYTVSALDNLVYREPVTGLQISAGLGLGVEFLLARHVGFYVDPSLRYYFNCYQPKSIRTQQPLMLNLEAGFRFNLGR